MGVVRDNLEQARAAGLLSPASVQQVSQGSPQWSDQSARRGYHKGEQTVAPVTPILSAPWWQPQRTDLLDRVDREQGLRRAVLVSYFAGQRVPRAPAPVAGGSSTDQMLRRYVTWVVDRPRTVIAAVVAITLALGFCASRLKVLLDLDDQLPPGHALVVAGKRIEKLFVGKYLTIVGLIPRRVRSTARAPGQGQAGDGGARARARGQAGSVLSLMSRRVKDVHSSDESLEISLCPKACRTPRRRWPLSARAFRPTRSSPASWSAPMGAPPRCWSTSRISRRPWAPGVYPMLERIVAPERSPD